MGNALGAIEDPTSHRTVFVASLPHQVHATHYSASLSPAPQVWRGICGEFPRQLTVRAPMSVTLVLSVCDAHTRFALCLSAPPLQGGRGRSPVPNTASLFLRIHA